MPVINRIAEFTNDMKMWRRDIHAHPETAFSEERTSKIVANKLGISRPTVYKYIAQFDNERLS